MSDIVALLNVVDTTVEDLLEEEELVEESGFKLWIKRAWIMIQATMMTYYMIVGVTAYYRITDGWCKTKSLFVFQTMIIIYLLVNEFSGHHIQGIFLILLFT